MICAHVFNIYLLHMFYNSRKNNSHIHSGWYFSHHFSELISLSVLFVSITKKSVCFSMFTERNVVVSKAMQKIVKFLFFILFRCSRVSVCIAENTQYENISQKNTFCMECEQVNGWDELN